MQPSDDPPVSRQRWVSFAEAQRILGKSEGTLRREIKAGKVVGEERRRNPDSPTDLRMVYEVLVTDPPVPATDSESAQTPETRQEPPASSRWLLDKLDERDQSVREKDDLISRLQDDLRAESVARAAAEADARHASTRATDLAEWLAAAEAERARLAGELERERARSWLSRLLGRWPPV